MRAKRQKIGLFGGTFNPVHLGHIKAGRSVCQKFSLEKILFIPSYIPPHKEPAGVATAFHRLRMIELAVAPYSRFVPSSIEIDEGGKSYSIITLRKIKKIYPNALFYFILGIDAFLEIETWRDYRKVLEQCAFIVISRPGYDLHLAGSVLGDGYSGRIVDLTDKKKKRASFSELNIYLFEFEALSFSSTEIRRRVRKGASILGMVPRPVEIYIKENSLYR